MSTKYKNIEDHVYIKRVPEDWNGYENPIVEVTLKRGKYSADDERIMKSCIGEALLRFGAITQKPFKEEIKPYTP